MATRSARIHASDASTAAAKHVTRDHCPNADGHAAFNAMRTSAGSGPK